MKTGILSTIGRTPLIRLDRMFSDAHYRVFAKLEAFNPGGSIKDRTAFSIINRAIQEGIIHSGSTIVESSSGNMGIGLAQVCAYFNLRFICVVDVKTTRQNIEILKVYGAEVDVVSEPDPISGEYLDARIKRVQMLRDTITDAWWPDQYSNQANVMAHHQTMAEIVEELDGQLDYLFCAISTCGTLRGCSEYLRARRLPTKVIAVDAVGSVIFGQHPTRRLIPGHGASRIPPLFQEHLADACVHVSDIDCIIGCHQLLRREALLAGGSSGAVMRAVRLYEPHIPQGATCAVILCDRGERYLDTVYSERWIRKHFGEIEHLWNEPSQPLLVSKS